MTQSNPIVEDRIARKVRVSILPFEAPNGRLYAQLRPDVIGSEDYADYKEATIECRFMRQWRKNLVPLPKVSEVIRALRVSGFGADPHQTLIDSIREKSTSDWLDRRSVEERINSIEAEFYKRRGLRFFPFQRSGANWLSSRMGALLADDMGLGKTLQAIAAIPANAPVVTIGPVSAKSVWRREIQNWRPSIQTFTISGRGNFRWPNAGEMVILNFDILPNIHETRCDGMLPKQPCVGCKEVQEFRGGHSVVSLQGHKEGCDGFRPRVPCFGCAAFLKAAPMGTVVIVDEAHRVKNPKTDRAKATRAIASAVRGVQGRNWLLTGTPLENEPKELWSVLQTAGIALEAFESWDNYVSLFKGKALPFGGFNWGLPEDEASAEDITERLQRVSLRRRKVDVLKDLPAKIWEYVEVEIDRPALQACEKYLKSSGKSIDELVALVEKETIKFETMTEVRSMLAKVKIPAMLRLVDEYEDQNEPVVVFSSFKAPIEQLAKRPGWKVIMGGVESEARAEIERAFQAGELRGVGCTIRAGAEAITLTRANRAIFVDLDWTPTKNAQAEDRICRIGQTRGTIYQILMAEHVLDQRLTEVLHKKSKLISMSVDRAAVKDEESQPVDADLEAMVKMVHEEVSSGAERLAAVLPMQKEILDDLHSLVFENPYEGRIAVDLAQEGSIIGLTRAQWELAAKIASCGVTVEHAKLRVPYTTSKKIVENKQEDNMTDKEEPKKPAADPKQTTPSTKVVTPSKVALLKRDIRALQDEEREELFDWIADKFCIHCGEGLPKGNPEDHDCPYADEGDDEDDDEDGETESDEDEDEDDDRKEET